MIEYDWARMAWEKQPEIVHESIRTLMETLWILYGILLITPVKRDFWDYIDQVSINKINLKVYVDTEITKCLTH